MLCCRARLSLALISGRSAYPSLSSTFSTFRDDDVLVGSELALNFGSEPVDVRVVNGDVQGLSLRVVGREGCSNRRSITVRPEPVVDAPGDRTRYVVRMMGDDTPTSATNPVVCAEIPPRYFGLRIVTGGDVELAGSIKEARDVLIRTRGGAISSSGSVTSETLSLVSDGGAIRAAQVMANNAVVDADSNNRGIGTGDVHIGRASCLHLLCKGDRVRIESLISSAADVRGTTIDVENANTLDGEAALSLRGRADKACSLRLGGVDGSIVLDDGTRAAVMEVQLNKNARKIEYKTCEATRVSCFKPQELRLVVDGSGEGDADDDAESDAESEEAPRCRVVGGKGRVEVTDRGWRESFLMKMANCRR